MIREPQLKCFIKPKYELAERLRACVKFKDARSRGRMDKSVDFSSDFLLIVADPGSNRGRRNKS